MRDQARGLAKAAFSEQPALDASRPSRVTMAQPRGPSGVNVEREKSPSGSKCLGGNVTYVK